MPTPEQKRVTKGTSSLVWLNASQFGMHPRHPFDASLVWLNRSQFGMHPSHPFDASMRVAELFPIRNAPTPPIRRVIGVAESFPIRNARTPPIRRVDARRLELLEQSCDRVKLKISTRLAYFFCSFFLLFVDGRSSYLVYCCLQQQYVKYLLLHWYCLLQQWSAVIVASRQYHFRLFLFFFVLFVLFSGGPIWPYMFVVPDFGATLVTPSMWAMGGGPIWPRMSVVPDFGATRATSVCCGLWGPTWPCMSGTRLWCHACEVSILTFITLFPVSGLPCTSTNKGFLFYFSFFVLLYFSHDFPLQLLVFDLCW